MRTIFLSILLAATGTVNAQTLFTGTIGPYPVELQVGISYDGTQGVYLYKSTNIPIEINSRIRDSVWTLTEKDGNNKDRARFTFQSFNKNNTLFSGIWKDLSTGRELPVTLTKKYDADASGNDISWNNREIIQLATVRENYFRAVVNKNKDAYYPVVTAIRLMDRKTDQLIQEFGVECQPMGTLSVSTGDFNFDGQQDFSVFEQSYAGPNTSSLYYLYDPAKRTYVQSEISGISLAFDAKTKTVTETNQSGAGRYLQVDRYKIVNNKMVKVSSKEYEWDDKQQDLVEKKKPAPKKKHN